MNFDMKKIRTRLDDGVILRNLRKSYKPKGLTTRELATMMGVVNSLITHWEWGRNPIPEDRILQACKIFSITKSEWDQYKSGRKLLEIDYKTECLSLLQKLDDNLIPPIYSMIYAMYNQNK